MEYILFIHDNIETSTTQEQWDLFFAEANRSGIFLGGNEIANPIIIGDKAVAAMTNSIVGLMRFETDDIGEVMALLEFHPVKIKGGTLELCEMPKS